MNIEQLRDFCLSLPDTEEKMPFEAFFRNHESLLAFYVGGHIFCMADIDAIPGECTVKAEPDEIPVLEDAYKAVGKPYNFSPGHWISIKFDSDMPDDMIESLVKKSYELILKK